MRSSQSSCSGLFVCTAILCWDYRTLKYAFFNITNCTPRPLYFQTNVHLTSRSNNSSKIQSNYSINGFICSNCTRDNFIASNFKTSIECYQQTTKIKLKNYCHFSFQYKQNQSFCQCFPSDRPIQPITDWVKALVKPGKSHLNTNRVNDINQSASSFIYILVAFILLLVFFGGIIAMIFYWIQFKSCQQRTLK